MSARLSNTLTSFTTDTAAMTEEQPGLTSAFGALIAEDAEDSAEEMAQLERNAEAMAEAERHAASIVRG